MCKKKEEELTKALKKVMGSDKKWSIQITNDGTVVVMDACKENEYNLSEKRTSGR